MLSRPTTSLLLALASLPLAASTLMDIDGSEHRLPDPAAEATVVYFVTHDCPISNRFMPEIRRICTEYSSRDTRCLLAYVDPTVSADQIREHRRTYEHAVPAVHDSNHALVDLAEASVTPEAAPLPSRRESRLSRSDQQLLRRPWQASPPSDETRLEGCARRGAGWQSRLPATHASGGVFHLAVWDGPRG